MLVSVSLSEGDYFYLVEASPLEISESFKTGRLRTRYAGELELAAIKLSPESPMIYDFILKKYSGKPIRYVRNHYRNRFTWARW